MAFVQAFPNLLSGNITTELVEPQKPTDTTYIMYSQACQVKFFRAPWLILGLWNNINIKSVL